MKRSQNIRGINLSSKKILFLCAVVVVAFSMLYVVNQWNSSRELKRHEAINAQFYEQVNGRYVTIAKRVTSLDASVGELPNLEGERDAFVKEYRALLDSTFAPILHSALYAAAQQNVEPHNNKMFEMIMESYPNAFWVNSEQLFKAADDPLANKLRQANRAPRYQPRCCHNSQALQAANVAYYKIKLNRYKIATVQEWVIDYRQRANLPPLSDELLGHYEHLIELDKAAADAASAAAKNEKENHEHTHEHTHECNH